MELISFILILVLEGVLVHGDFCTTRTGVTVVDCPARGSAIVVPPCVEKTFNGPGDGHYLSTVDVPFDIIITDIDITGTNKITIGRVACDSGDGTESCKLYELSSDAEPRFSLHNINSANFRIRGAGSVSFYIDNGECNSHPCRSISPQVSGVYDVSYEEKTIEVFCEFRGDHGYMFLPTQVLQANPNINVDFLFEDKSKALIKFKYQGSQYDAEIGQIPAFNSIPLSIQNSAHVGYQLQSHQGVVVPPYLHFGMVPKNQIVRHTIQGYNVNGNDYTFSNCDANPNSYFAFFLGNNMANDANPNAGGSWGIRPWFTHKVAASVSVPDRFFYRWEMHQGGCGVYHITTGAAIGMRFPTE